MDRRAFCSQARVLVVAGKGGVGKTTVTAALCRMAADAGLDVLVVALESSGALPALFGMPGELTYEEQQVYEAAGGGESGAREPGGGEPGGGEPGGTVRARVITPDEALLEYLMDHGMKRVARRLVSTGVLDVIATAIPGIREILVLGKVKQVERAGIADLVVLDAPATGHAVRFLTSASGLLDAARGGPLRSQATDVVEMLHDPERCQVLLVTLPEETPVNELVETAFRFEDEVGVMLGPVVVNACYEPFGAEEVDSPEALAAVATAAGAELETGEATALLAAARFRIGREHVQSEQFARLAADLPLPRLRLPYLFGPEVAEVEVGELAEALGRAVDSLPDAPEVG